MGSAWRYQKGQDFERTVCRWLSLWISRGENPNCLWRSSQSGGRATTLQKTGQLLAVQAGDVAAIDRAGSAFTDVFFVECKCLKTIRLDSSVYKHKSGLVQIWEKCSRQAAYYRKVPVLIFREYRKPPMLCLPGWLWRYCDLPDTLIIVVHPDSIHIGQLESLGQLDPNEFLNGAKHATDAYYG